MKKQNFYNHFLNVIINVQLFSIGKFNNINNYKHTIKIITNYIYHDILFIILNYCCVVVYNIIKYFNKNKTTILLYRQLRDLLVCPNSRKEFICVNQNNVVSYNTQTKKVKINNN